MNRQTVWVDLERRQRVEEVFESYRMRAEFPAAGTARVAWSYWSALLVDGRVLNPDSIELLARRFGLRVEVVGWPHEGAVDFDFGAPGHEAFVAFESGLVYFLELLREANPLRFVLRDHLEISIPQSGALPQSAAFLERMYGGGFIPAEKKPIVVDLDRTRGAYMVSVDDDPLVILEAMSQISTLPAGFAPAVIERAIDEGEFDELVLHSREDTPAAAAATEAFEQACRDTLAPALAHFSHTGSGAEANEKAFHIARLYGKGGNRVVAFEGSFHGRTLMSLFATWNPEKRVPYEIPGYEALFAPFPPNPDPRTEPPFDASWISLWSSTDSAAKHTALELATHDPLLRREIECLLEVERLISRDDACCLIVEPMQSEGGDNYGSARFFNGLRALTRAHGVPFIIDEVQTGFGLGGPAFWWHHRFGLRRADGTPDHPDIVTWAKKCQIGGIASVWPDPYPSNFQPAGALKGALHAQAIHAGDPAAMEAQLYEELHTLQRVLPEGLVKGVRACGYAFALDLPTSDIADKIVNQRFYRGAVVYKAGDRTLRYRLNTEFDADKIRETFKVIRTSLEALIAWAGGEGQGGADLWARMDAAAVPSWVAPAVAEETGDSLRRRILRELPLRALDDTYAGWLIQQMARDANSGVEDAIVGLLGELDEPTHRQACAFVGLEPGYGETRDVVLRVCEAWAGRAAEFRARIGVSLARFTADYLGVRMRRITPAEWGAYGQHIIELQAAVYEPARRDDPGFLQWAVSNPDFIAVVAESRAGHERTLVGFSLAGPLEFFPDINGPKQDVNRGRNNTLYSADITVHPSWRGKGVGIRLKAAQIRVALQARTETGDPRYVAMTGRNRLGHAHHMLGINSRFGAYEVATYKGEYGTPEGLALYYRIPLRRTSRTGELPKPESSVDARQGIVAPLGTAHSELVWARDHGRFDTATLSKLTLSNFVSPQYARYVEALRALAPSNCPHFYGTSCRGETVDKTVRALRVARPQANTVLSFEGTYVGESTAACRSISDFSDAPEAARLSWFDWARVPYPAWDRAACGEAHTDFLRDLFTVRVDSAAQTAQRIRAFERGVTTLSLTAALSSQLRVEVEALAALERKIAERGAARVLGLVGEVVQERTARTLSPRFWRALERLCHTYDIPLVVSETASALFRFGAGTFWGIDAIGIRPDAVLWFAGGQQGHVFVGDRYFLAKPLQLISTWDGDELSARRLHYTLRAVHREPVAERAQAFAYALERAHTRAGGAAVATLRTAGLYASILPVTGAQALPAKLEALGVRVLPGFRGHAVLAPPLVASGAQISRIAAAVEEALRPR